MTAGQTLTYSEDDFTVMEGGSVQGNLELVGIVSDAPEIISVNGLAVTMHAVEEDETGRMDAGHKLEWCNGKRCRRDKYDYANYFNF